jgi:hypothetical protein
MTDLQIAFLFGAQLSGLTFLIGIGVGGWLERGSWSKKTGNTGNG